MRSDGATPRSSGGLAGPVERVVVVGAGIAGLSASTMLTRAGVPCLVLEARNRIGGRLHTIELAGQPVDLGGSWIHHPIGNPLTGLVDELGIPRRRGDPVPELAAHDLAEARRLSDVEVQAEVSLLYDNFPAAIDQLRADLGPEASAADGIDRFIEQRGLTPPQARRARQGLRALVEGESADLPERQSLAWMWNEHEYGGGFFGDLPEGGYRRVLDALAVGSDVRLGFEVAHIDVEADQVRLTSTTGQIERATHTVVTVPLGVLKDGRPRFSPPLPAPHMAAIERLGYGRFEKIALRFPNAFWRAAGAPQLMVFPENPDESTIWIIGHDAFDTVPTLVVFVFHALAERMQDWTERDRVLWALELLGQVLGAPCPEPIAVAVTDWARDPLSLGSYSHITPESSPHDADLLGEPVHGRVLFAGEHTQSTRLVYTDGARASGLREAARLLQQRRTPHGPT